MHRDVNKLRHKQTELNWCVEGIWWQTIQLPVPTCPSGFPRIALRTLQSPIYLLVVVAQVNQAGLLAGLATFMAKFIERQFSQTISFSTMMIGETLGPVGLLECALVCEVGAERSAVRRVFFHLVNAGSLTFHLVSFRRSVYPAGGAGYGPGRSCDAKAESVGERCQQVVHQCCLHQYADCHTSAVHRLLHPEGRGHLSSRVTAPSVYLHQKHTLYEAWGTNSYTARELIYLPTGN